jgi:hypothetical protein
LENEYIKNKYLNKNCERSHLVEALGGAVRNRGVVIFFD